MSKPLVSVIVPSYNHEKYIQENINSIINQTYQNIELLIVDDGSKDSTFQKIKEMEEVCKKRFINFHFETKENEGLCLTLNKLISLSKGEYVYIIASDDMIKLNAIEKQLEFLMQNPDHGLCVGDNELIDKDSKICYWDKNQNLLYTEDAEFKTFGAFLQKINKINFNSDVFGTYKSLYFDNYIPNGYLIRKSILEKVGGYKKEAPLEDWYIMLQISKYTKMKFLDKVLFSYRVHPTNTIKNKEKMIIFYEQTFKYENEVILPNIDFSQVKNDVKDVYENGVLIKNQGIPFIFQILTYKKYNNERKKEIKVFGFTVLKYTK